MKKTQSRSVLLALCLMIAAPAFAQDGALPTENADVTAPAAPGEGITAEAAAEPAPATPKARSKKKKKHTKNAKKKKKSKAGKKKKKHHKKSHSA